MARETWDVKIVPQLNHDLFSFTKAMKEGWPTANEINIKLAFFTLNKKFRVISPQTDLPVKIKNCHSVAGR